MIIKQKNKYKSFNDYFFEADDDESNSPQVERYSIKPHKRRGNDYTAIEPDDDESNQSPEVLNDDNDQSSDYSETNDVPANNQDDNSGGNDAAVLDDDGGDEGSDYTRTIRRPTRW